jgi:hypothetical protein
VFLFVFVFVVVGGGGGGGGGAPPQSSFCSVQVAKRRRLEPPTEQRLDFQAGSLRYSSVPVESLVALFDVESCMAKRFGDLRFELRFLVQKRVVISALYL